jgi:magnesium transporter
MSEGDSVVAAVVYRDGRRLRELSLDDAEGWAREAGDLVWIGLHEPGPGQLEALRARFGLHELAVEDAGGMHELPKCEEYGPSLFLVLRTVQLEDGRMAFGETHIFAGADYIITIRQGASRTHAPLRRKLEANPELLARGVDYVLHAMLSFVVDGYEPVIAMIGDEVAGMQERTLERPLSRQEVRRIFQLRADLLRLRRVAAPMAEVCALLEHVRAPFIDDEIRPYFRDAHDNVRRVAESIDTLRELLSFVFEAGLLLESQRQGEITRRFAGWAAILAVPTAIAGIYGMNFEHMPELRWTWGYPAVLGVIALLVTALWVGFRRARWI